MRADDGDIAARLGRIGPMTDADAAAALASCTLLHGKVQPGDLLYRFDDAQSPTGAFGYLVVRGGEIVRVVRVGGY